MLLGSLRTYYKPFWALRDIDLEVRRGDSVGIVGRNGCGKSTLLQIICGMTSAWCENLCRVVMKLLADKTCHPQINFGWLR